jgi:hypothetical protein
MSWTSSSGEHTGACLYKISRANGQSVLQHEAVALAALVVMHHNVCRQQDSVDKHDDMSHVRFLL